MSLPKGAGIGDTGRVSPSPASTTDLVALYDELVLSGRAPAPEEFSADHPQHPTLLPRLEQLTRLRGDLEDLFGPVSDPAPEAPAVAEIPGFRIIRPIGSGGMGTVYLAEQLSPRRFCALKLLQHGLPAARDRFRREADLAARLSHPGIATVYAFGVEGGVSYLAAEMVHGFSLRALLHAADLVSPESPSDWLVDAVRRVSEGAAVRTPATATAPVATMVGLAIEIADALAHAHLRGVIHRDVKPSNIIVTLGGSAKLIDFGIAVGAEDTDDRLTRTGTFIGSHGYAAPEQLRGEHDVVGSWTDTYALGATLFEMLTQRTPFEAVTFADRLGTAAQAPRHGPRHYNPKVPRELDGLVMRALTPDPEQRFHDGEELAEALRRCSTRPSVIPGLPTHLLAKVLPRTLAEVVAIVGVISTGVLASLYVEKKDEHARTRAALEASQVITGNAVLDLVLREEKPALESCLQYDRRLTSAPTAGARFVAELTVSAGVVIEVARTGASTNIGVRAQDCMAERLKRLELPGVGGAMPVTLRLDLRVSPADPPARR